MSDLQRVREPQAAELLFEVSKRDGVRVRWELCDLGYYGVEVRFFRNGKFWYSQWFDERSGHS